MKKKVLAVILTAVCTMGLMAGCGNSNVGNTNTQKNASSAEDGYKIGISQFASAINHYASVKISNQQGNSHRAELPNPAVQ